MTSFNNFGEAKSRSLSVRSNWMGVAQPGTFKLDFSRRKDIQIPNFVCEIIIYIL